MSEPETPEQGSAASERPVLDDPVEADEAELLAAFDRLRPQGGLRWGFDDAMRRIVHPDTGSASGMARWDGLPDDLWERGRSARIGQRFVGDVAGVLASVLAADARAVAGAAVAGANTATWDALRYLAARVELLEARADASGLQVADLSMRPPDLSEWEKDIGSWLGASHDGGTVVVGESGDGILVRALLDAGWVTQAVEPRGQTAWGAFAAPPDHPEDVVVDFVIAEVLDHLGTLPDNDAPGVVLAGCVDRLDLSATLDLLRQSCRVLETGGTLVVLTTDQAAWDRSLSPPARDLAPGRPLHPETWALMLRRAGLVDVEWHQPRSGSVHAMVAKAGR